MSFNPLDWIKFAVECFDKRKKESQQALIDTKTSLNAILAKIETIDSEIKKVNDNSSAFHDEELEFKQFVTKELLTIKQGLQKELFNTLYIKQKRFIEQGKCSAADKGEYQETYDVYHKMGKNGRADRYLQNVLNLPEE